MRRGTSGRRHTTTPRSMGIVKQPPRHEVHGLLHLLEKMQSSSGFQVGVGERSPMTAFERVTEGFFITEGRAFDPLWRENRVPLHEPVLYARRRNRRPHPSGWRYFSRVHGPHEMALVIVGTSRFREHWMEMFRSPQPNTRRV